MTRTEKHFAKRSQMAKFNELIVHLTKEFEDVMSYQKGDFVKIPKSHLKWLIDLIRK